MNLSSLFVARRGNQKPSIVTSICVADKSWTYSPLNHFKQRPGAAMSFCSSAFGRVCCPIVITLLPLQWSNSQTPPIFTTGDLTGAVGGPHLLINLGSQVELHMAILTWLQIILHQERSIWTQAQLHRTTQFFGLPKWGATIWGTTAVHFAGDAYRKYMDCFQDTVIHVASSW